MGNPGTSTRIYVLILALLLTLPVVSACGRVSAAAVPRTYAGRTIVTLSTVGMVQDVVREVGGDRVRADALMGPGVDPHLYKPSEGDVLRIGEADVIFYVGLHLEGKMTDILERSGETRVVEAVAEGIDPAKLRRPPEFAGAYDPHVWMDVSLWMKTVDTVEQTLRRIDPGSARAYAGRARTYRAELRALHAYARARIATIPRQSRVLITAHDAFGYFGRAYGMEVLGLQGLSTETEAGVGDVRRLARTLTERRVKAVFVESSVPRRNIDAVRAAARSQGWDVGVGGQLYSDAMGDAGTPDGTYVGMIRHNVDTIVAALR